MGCRLISSPTAWSHHLFFCIFDSCGVNNRRSSLIGRCPEPFGILLDIDKLPYAGMIHPHLGLETPVSCLCIVVGSALKTYSKYIETFKNAATACSNFTTEYWLSKKKKKIKIRLDLDTFQTDYHPQPEFNTNTQSSKVQKRQQLIESCKPIQTNLNNKCALLA